MYFTITTIKPHPTPFQESEAATLIRAIIELDNAGPDGWAQHGNIK